MTQPDGDHANLQRLHELKKKARQNRERAIRQLADADADCKAIDAAIAAVERSRETAEERARRRWFPPASVILAALAGLGSILASMAHHARNHILLAAATVTGGVALVTLPVTLPMMDASPDHHPRKTAPAPPRPSWATRPPARTHPKAPRTPSPSPIPSATPTGTAPPTASPPVSPSPSGTTPTPETTASPPTETTPPPSTSSTPVQEQPPDQAAPPPGDQPPARATEEPVPVDAGPAMVEVSLCRVNIALPPLLRVRATCT